MTPHDQAIKYAHWVLGQSQWDEKTGVIKIPDLHRSLFGIALQIIKNDQKKGK